MAILKCKMCGGDILLNEDKTTGTCDHCGSTMTFPRVSDEQKLNLYNRANHFRQQNEFDKAITAYDKILDQDDTDAEAHWGAVLSRYGIEYVEDPVTHERIPTCHRVQISSILSDGDYLAALENAPDTASRDLYEQEAHRIAEIQKGILSISSQEKPYDVFICYKETDDFGSRTKDSTLAQEIYYQLANEGYKVFFSRITLEDKLGQQYEPYILAALNSAKVMLVVGTKPEYFNAVWVKNEWSRYLALMKNDRRRLLIPCYRDMDPYDLPEELSALQSQDMSKNDFVQDLTHDVKKVLDIKKTGRKKSAVSQTVSSGANIENLMKQARLFMEDGDLKSANEYLDKALDEEADRKAREAARAEAKKKRYTIPAIAFIILAIAAYFPVTKYILPQGHYDKDVSLRSAGQWELASYKTEGSYVTFGTYPQTSSGTDSTPIEWLVLDYDAANNRALLISRYGLDAKPYNTEYTSITWEKCTLRTWLNSTFYNKAFSGNEQSAILLTNMDNSNSQSYSGWSTRGENNTQDKIFLLSYAEANKYFNVTYWDINNTYSRVQPTAYATKQGAYTSSNKTADGAAAGWWWLRSPGDYPISAASVYYGGSLSYGGVSDTSGAVRPAFWLNLNTDIF